MKLLGILFLLCVLTMPVVAQDHCRIMFYNVENLFDTADDPSTADDEFTPRGKKHWTKAKYTDKLLKIAEVIDSVGDKELPCIVGLAEVENRWVLEDLTQKTALADGNYGIVHQDSPDRRGIDVALLYRKDCFELLEADFLRLSFPEDTTIRTRDILYASGVLDSDTLHFFVCHFPSMIGGEKQSEWRRERAASTVRHKVDSLLAVQPRAGIVIMGDLNGKANTPAQGNWQTIDHLILSGALLDGHSVWKADRRLTVFSAPFLLEEDKTYFGYKPCPTYRGPRYVGGYSDHLPIYIDLKK